MVHPLAQFLENTSSHQVGRSPMMIDPTAVRARLRQELEVLTRRHAALEAHLRNIDRELPEDFADLATTVENDEVMEGLDDAARAGLGAIRAALARLEGGGYGICAECGGNIGERRLDALPTATHCIEHAD
jgi:RNA polymerase-binding transcription factor DksA